MNKESREFIELSLAIMLEKYEVFHEIPRHVLDGIISFWGSRVEKASSEYGYGVNDFRDRVYALMKDHPSGN